MAAPAWVPQATPDYYATIKAEVSRRVIIPPSQQVAPEEHLRNLALKLLTAWTHGDLYRYCDTHNHEAVRHILAIAERKYPADTDIEAKYWYEFEHMLMLAVVYKVTELRGEAAVADVDPV
jgi:hypothetical protein